MGDEGSYEEALRGVPAGARRFGRRRPGRRAPGPASGSEGELLEPLVPRVFDKTSPVTAYWLTRCGGFEVRVRRRLGRVEAILFADDPLKPVALRVRGRFGRVRHIAVDAIAATCPRERVLYVRRRHAIAPAARRSAVLLGTAGARAGRSVAAALAASQRAAAPRLRLAAFTTAAAVREGARRAWPHAARGIVLAAEVALFTALLLVELLLRLALALGRGSCAVAALGIRRVRAALPERAVLGSNQ